jgi:hypothetical protein
MSSCNIINCLIGEINCLKKELKEIKDKLEPPFVRDELFITFEDYDTEPISQSDIGKIQKEWSGGAQPYFQNDTPGEETITGAFAQNGSKSWFTGNAQLYGLPSQGSPYTPALNIEKDAADETAFNEAIKGKTFCYRFYVRANTSDGENDQSALKVYNGSYDGKDRTGLNINIIKNATLDVTTFTYSSGVFTEITLGNLSYNTWHKFEVFITYAEDGDPNNDVFKYVINDGTPQFINSWPNLWRLDNSFPLSYGSRLAFASGTNLESGWYIDEIALIDPPRPIVIPFNYISLTGPTGTYDGSTVSMIKYEGGLTGGFTGPFAGNGSGQDYLLIHNKTTEINSVNI